jgi:protocatechuate 3,4-dioxygenase beta subunit
MNRLFDRRNEKFLRGHQLTDASGTARFTTIYPGWYAGRAVHLHFSVRAKDADGRDVLFTSQLYFDDAVTAAVLATDPYVSKGTAGWRRNRADRIFSRNGGEQLMLATRPQGEGYAGVFELGMQLG